MPKLSDGPELQASGTRRFLYLDIDSFPHEGFTSGLLIAAREMLKKLRELGHQIHIASVAKSNDLSGLRKRVAEEIQITEFFLPSLVSDIESTVLAVRSILTDINPDVILMNTPAVFFNEAHIEVLRTAINTRRKIIMVVADELFPTEENFPGPALDQYYELYHSENLHTYAVSNRISTKFSMVAGQTTGYFPQLFDLDKIIAEVRSDRYIVMANTHPIKGVSIFDETAKLMPEQKFMIVDTWTDVPEYKSQTNNVTRHSMFTSPKDLYAIARMLLVPSLCNEGASRVVIEALINGIPVIANKIGSLPEIGGDLIQFIDPPTITGYKFAGTIMYPIIDPKELHRVAQDFSRKITEIDANYVAYSNLSREAGLSYCTENNNEFLRLVKRWII